MVFTRRDGRYSGTDVIKYPFKIIRNELGIKARFYDLRGSFATTSLRNGCEIKDIAEVLGHTRIETTEKYYISSTDNDKIKVTKSFENSLKI
jgi:integrase